MGQLFVALIKACVQALRGRAKGTALRLKIPIAVATAAVAIVGMAGVAQAGSVSADSRAAVLVSMAGSAQGSGSSTPCFQASYPDCSSTDPNVTFHDVSEGDTAGCEFQESVAWDDGTTNAYTFAGGPDGTQLATFTHLYKQPGTYAITTTAQTTVGSCSSGDSTLEFTLLAAGAPPSACTKAYDRPASWDTERAISDVPGIADYVEPINVIISACSTVSLSDIQAALGDWSTVSDTTSITFHGFRLKCISPEKADVAGQGYVTEDVAWRLDGCLKGNALSLIGREDHVRIWNQPAENGGSFGAWFITASYETACVSNNGKLYTLFDDGSHITSSTRFFHCIDGGPGSFSTNGYNRGAKDFADDVKAAALKQHWHVSLETITRPILGGQDVGEDGVTFDGTVYVLTVTK